MIAAIFPGQGSQRPGMGRELWEAHEVARDVFAEVTEATDIDMVRLCFETDEETLRRTENAQLALFTSSVAAFRVLTFGLRRLPSATVEAVAGHSVGEYAALVAGGVLSVPEGARLVKLRGELMSRSGVAAPGTMAAVLGLERDALASACVDAGGTVVVANDNCPGQLVISGEASAVARAGDLAQTRGAKRVLPLNVSGAFHSPLMDTAADEMGRRLRQTSFQAPISEMKIYANVTAEPAGSPEGWPFLLESQLKSPVRWTETIRNMIRDGVTLLIECGSGEVLSGLIKRIDRTVETQRVIDEVSYKKTLEAITALT
jgi:[acyl-carrier-protein] S-malonyltransferase